MKISNTLVSFMFASHQTMRLNLHSSINIILCIPVLLLAKNWAQLLEAQPRRGHQRKTEFYNVCLHHLHHLISVAEILEF